MTSTKPKEITHKPVLVKETLVALGLGSIAPLKSTDKKSIYIDATVGAGGHSLEIVKKGGYVLGIDDDPKMLARAEKNLKSVCPATLDSKESGFFKLVLGNFCNIDSIASSNGVSNVDGILFDLGISTFHLLSDSRGFSFQNPDLPLDMRLNTKTQGVTASDLLNSLPKDKLLEMFLVVLDYPTAKRISEKVVRTRKEKIFQNVGDLIQVVGRSRGDKKTNPATKPMMALRMAVNSELDNLELALPKAYNLLGKGGKLAVISFHSGEDRVVKKFFKKLDQDGLVKIIAKKPIIPSEVEIAMNPMSRSAKLRAIEKLPDEIY